MERYKEYKDSGVFWDKTVPSHWHVVKLKNILTKLNRTKPENADLLICSNKGTVFKRGDSKLGLVATDDSIYQGVANGDLLIHGMDTWHGAIAISYLDGMCTTVVHVCDSSQEKKYIAYYLRHMAFSKVFKLISNGVRQNTSDFRSWDKVGNIPIPLPPLSEQRAIVRFLDDKCGKIDRVVESKSKEIALLKELRQSVIAEAVTRGINPNATLKNSNIPWIGEIPEGWEVKRLALFFDENTRTNKDLEYTNAYQFNYGTLVPKKREYKESEDADVYSKYTIFQPNDIFINGLNLNYDFVSQRVAIAESHAIITSAYLCIRPRDKVNAKYFCYLFKAMDGMKLFHGMGAGIRLTLSYAELKKQYLPLPPLAEQRAIVAHIDAKCARIDAAIAHLQAEIGHFKDYRQRLISDAVTGRFQC